VQPTSFFEPSLRRKLIIPYFLLVGLPLLGLIGVLGIGRGVTPRLRLEGSGKSESITEQVRPSSAEFGVSSPGPQLWKSCSPADI
jgi:hypothetical protein